MSGIAPPLVQCPKCAGPSVTEHTEISRRLGHRRRRCRCQDCRLRFTVREPLVRAVDEDAAE